ncbi:hypothetical protein C8R42DRAFT_645674 [Lentinula raphanica]|nr:hypothetical protein C8R42DRAFT_645674 [Lentinula raphanica]
MYLFRIVFTRRSRAVHLLHLLSMIATAFALPIDPNTTGRRTERRIAPKGSEGGPSSGLELVSSAAPRKVIDRIETFYFAALMGGQMDHDPMTAEWVMTLVPSAFLTPGSSQTGKVWGYRTRRDPQSTSNFEWTRQQSRASTNVNGASITVTPTRLHIKIGEFQMSQDTKALLTKALTAVVDKKRIDKLPNIPSGYQYALILEDQLKTPQFQHTIRTISWDISKNSEYGEAFDKMIENKASGTGFLLLETDTWERELYERIKSGKVKLDESLKSDNHDILEDLWDEVHGTGHPATPSQHPSLPDTSPQNPPVPATPESQHPPLPAWALKEQDVYTDPRWKHRENWPKEELDNWPSDPSGTSAEGDKGEGKTKTKHASLLLESLDKIKGFVRSKMGREDGEEGGEGADLKKPEGKAVAMEICQSLERKGQVLHEYRRNLHNLPMEPSLNPSQAQVEPLAKALVTDHLSSSVPLLNPKSHITTPTTSDLRKRCPYKYKGSGHQHFIFLSWLPPSHPPPSSPNPSPLHPFLFRPSSPVSILSRTLTVIPCAWENNGVNGVSRDKEVLPQNLDLRLNTPSSIVIPLSSSLHYVFKPNIRDVAIGDVECIHRICGPSTMDDGRTMDKLAVGRGRLFYNIVKAQRSNRTPPTPDLSPQDLKSKKPQKTTRSQTNSRTMKNTLRVGNGYIVLRKKKSLTDSMDLLSLGHEGGRKSKKTEMDCERGSLVIEGENSGGDFVVWSSSYILNEALSLRIRSMFGVTSSYKVIGVQTFTFKSHLVPTSVHNPKSFKSPLSFLNVWTFMWDWGACANDAQNEALPKAAKEGPRPVMSLLFRLVLRKPSREGLIVSPFFQVKIFKFAVQIGGKAEWTEDPNSDTYHLGKWLIGITPPELHKQKTPKARGYRTIRNRASQSDFKWEQQRDSDNPTSVNGALVTVTPQHTCFVIATLQMSENTKKDLNNAMRPVIAHHRIDKIPTILSIYQYAVLFQRKLAEKEFRDNVKIIGKFDISETSPFREAFDRMVKKKATGAGDVLQKKEDIWEWELYEQVEHHGPHDILEKSLDRQNRDILEDLWNKVHGTGLITTLSHNMPLPDTSPQNPPVPATPESQHPPLPAWALKEQDVYTDPRWKHRENWPKEELDNWPSDPSGHH